MLRLAPIAILLLLSAGCYPVTRMQTPRTTPAGRVQGAVGFAAAVAPEHASPLSLSPDAWLGVGVHERVDLSLRLRPAAVEVGGKVQLVREAVEVSLAPAFIAAAETEPYQESRDASTNVSVKAGRLTLYVGSDGDEPLSAWVAPTLDVGVRSHPAPGNGSDAEPLVAPGLLAGLVVAATGGLRVLLEAGVLLPSAGNSDVEERERAVARLGRGDTRLELNLALRFGAYD